MAKKRILITVKTYPTLSKRYIELVCTAGITEDGEWIRIYPSPFRFLDDDQRYKKYQWVELELEKNPKDHRPESYRPTNIDDVTLGDWISTERQWENRREEIKKLTIHTNLAEIIAAAKSNNQSLALFKPTQILDFTAEATEADWGVSKKEAAKAALSQGSLFDNTDHSEFKLMPKLPFKFRYKFKDDAGIISNMMIED